MSKEKKYRDLVEKAKKNYIPKASNPRDLVWCEDCEEINLWTYWQGRGNIDTCKVLLVGQDWGSISDKCCDSGLKNVRKMNKNIRCNYMDDNLNETNMHLVELFKILGYEDITVTKKERQKNQELFFTNLCLGYRQETTSGYLPLSKLHKDLAIFKELVNLLKPEVIICLGRNTWMGAIKALVPDAKPIVRNFNQCLDNRDNYVEYHYDDGENAKVFGVAHPGSLGTLNRNRTINPKWKPGCGKEIKKYITCPSLSKQKEDTCPSLSKQKEDWKYIKTLLDK